MKKIIVLTVLGLATSGVVSHTQSVATSPEQAAVAATPQSGLADLDAITFACPKAALNAAAREASKVRSLGTYQFAYFRINSDSHHASYEIHFKSNYEGEADLNYCVALYCQQGWDPASAKASVTLMGSAKAHAGAAAHGSECAAKTAPVKRAAK